MKNIFLSVIILLFVTSCTKNISNNQKIALGGGGKGGNPEVKVINECFKLKSKARDICLDSFYPNDINISIYPYNGDIIRLAGRKSSIEKREFDLSQEDRFILYIDTTNIELPISCNIQTAKRSLDKNSLVIDIAVKDIVKQVTIQDKNGRVLLDYSIVK